jgi:hypothetical protein
MSFDLQLDLTQLTNLVIQLERDDIQTADALLVRITGDYIGSRMLARLLYWFPRSVKQGWVYKSWRDWGAEVGISPAQIKRVHQQGILEQVGIQRRLMKAHGAPTTHYRLDIMRFYRRLRLSWKPQWNPCEPCFRPHRYPRAKNAHAKQNSLRPNLTTTSTTRH